MSEIPPIAEPSAPDEPVGAKERAPLWLALLFVWSCVSSLIGTVLTNDGPDFEPYQWWIAVPITGLWACLCIACYNGVNWARWLIIVPSVLLSPLLFLPDDVPQQMPAKIWKFVDGTTCLVIAGVLLLPSMKRYFVGVPQSASTEP